MKQDLVVHTHVCKDLAAQDPKVRFSRGSDRSALLAQRGKRQNSNQRRLFVHLRGSLLRPGRLSIAPGSVPDVVRQYGHS